MYYFAAVGGFTWSGHFTWVDIPQSELARRGSPIAPTRSPTMAGGLFAVARETFWQLGSYDEEMDVWGGENLEMSFRIWQCGGVLETIPCSRVGHIFRSFHPYTFPGNKDTHGINTARTVEVWLEDYKRLFYMHRPDLLNIEIGGLALDDYFLTLGWDSATKWIHLIHYAGSLTSRLAWKEEQHCKPFSWFLSTVYPEKFVLDDPGHVFAYGRLRNPSTGSCLDNLQNEVSRWLVLALHAVAGQGQLRAWSVRLSLLHGRRPVLLLLPAVPAAERRHLRHGVRPLPRPHGEGGDGGLQQGRGRGAGVVTHPGGQAAPQADWQVPGRRARPAHGDLARRTLPEPSLPGPLSAHNQQYVCISLWSLEDVSFYK